MITLAELNGTDRAGFVATLGGIYEHSPWVAERAWEARPFESREALARALQEAVRRADRAEQLALLRAHPRLGVKADLSEYSHAEQRGAGLTRAPAGARDELIELNRAYDEKFGFPFILAVKNRSVRQIIDSCRSRLKNDAAAEFEESLSQVFEIAGFRLADLVADTPR